MCLLRNFISNSRDSIEAALILGYHTCFLLLNDGMCLNPSLNFKILRKIKKNMTVLKVPIVKGPCREEITAPHLLEQKITLIKPKMSLLEEWLFFQGTLVT